MAAHLQHQLLDLQGRQITALGKDFRGAVIAYLDG
jgi:hypothetical protein